MTAYPRIPGPQGETGATGATGPPGSAEVFAALSDLGLAERNIKQAQHRKNYEDATVWNEGWTNLSSWALGNAGSLVASGNHLYPPTTRQMGKGAANRSFAIASGARARIVGSIFKVNSPAPVNKGLVLIGISSDTAGAAPANGAGGGEIAGPNIKAIGFETQSGKPCYWDGTTLTYLAGSGLGQGLNYVSIFIDENYVSFTIRNGDVDEWRTTISRATAGTINNVCLWNESSVPEDTTVQQSGTYISNVGARAETPTIYPRTTVEGLQYKACWTYPDSTSTQRIRIAEPKTYDSRVPLPVVMYHHGVGEDELAPFTDTLKKSLIDDVVNDGYLVCSTAAHGTNWGIQDALDDYLDLYQYVRDHWNIGPVLILSQSMGGISGLLTLAERRIPNICGWAGIYPITSLAAGYASGTLTAGINTAYDIPGGGTYAAQTDGHDPQLMQGYNFRGVPMRFYASSADTIAIKTTNSDAFSTLVADYAKESTVVAATGNHGDSSHFQSSDLRAFFARCLAAT